VTVPEIVPAADKHKAKHRSVQKVIAAKKAGKQG
jgi:large subunit ribosomal protein L15